MIIRNIDLFNFMNISEAHLSFQNGINVLYGENGNGKSAVFEAIAFCLVDRKKGDTWKDYVKSGEKSFNIQMVLQRTEDENDLMYFSYVGNKSKGSVDKEIKYKKDIFTQTDASNFLEKTFDLNMIENTVFSMQDADPIIKMKPADRREIFKKIFNSDFPDIVKKVSDDKKAIDDSILPLTLKIDLLQKKAYPLYRIVEIDETELGKLKQELIESQSSELDKQKYIFYTQKMKELSDKQGQLAFATSKIESFLKNIKVYEQRIVPLAEQHKSKEEEIVKIDHDINNKKMAFVALKFKLEDHLNHTDIVSLEKEKESLFENRSPILVGLEVYRQYIETSKKGVCNSCGQKCDTDLLSSYQNIYSKLKIDLEDINKKIEEVSISIKSYNDKKIELEKSIDLLEKEIQSLTNKKEGCFLQKESIKQQISVITELQIPREKTLMGQNDEVIITLKESIIDLQKWCDENKIEIKETSIREAKAIQAEIDSILEQIQKNTLQQKLNEQTLKAKKEDKEEITTLSVQINELQLKSKNLEAVKKIYEIDFPSFINLQACQILEDYMNGFFKNTKNNFVVLLQQDKKGINFYYKANDDPEWINAKMVSGFETALLTLGFKVAVGHAYGNELIILDEPDKTADKYSSPKLFNTITNIGGFKQMFVITHKDEAMDLLRENGACIYNIQAGQFTREV
jgi:DNA repair exonuclease SbcCD ATPase subunit